MEYMVHIVEETVHAIVINANSKKEIKELFRKGDIDWAACDTIDATLKIDSITNLDR